MLYQVSQKKQESQPKLGSRTGHFENEMGCSKGFRLKPGPFLSFLPCLYPFAIH